jgi:hypothetical protein
MRTIVMRMRMISIRMRMISIRMRTHAYNRCKHALGRCRGAGRYVPVPRNYRIVEEMVTAKSKKSNSFGAT